MSIEAEMLKLPKLKHVGLALVEFVYSLEKGSFVERTTDWIYEPSKSVAFGFPSRGPEQIRLQFRQPYPRYLTERDMKQLEPGRFNHFKFRIKSPAQLADAARYTELGILHHC